MQPKIINIILILIFSTTCLAIGSQKLDSNKELKEGFVYVDKIDPSILIRLKYNSAENIFGKILPGYNGTRAVLSLEAMEALKNVQEHLVMRGYSLVLYDAYHPLKTYEEILNWANDKTIDSAKKDEYYPNSSKEQLISGKYIANKLAHIRGSTVDVTIISLNDKFENSPSKLKRFYKNDKEIVYINDGTVEMGSSYDLMDPVSKHNYEDLPDLAKENRILLKETMEAAGFKANNHFWWQYSLVREPYPDSKFDFDI